MDIEINRKEVGRRLRKAREKRRMKQREVAEILGMEPDSYGNIERGTESPSLLRIIQLCVIFHLKPSQLLDDCCPELILQDTLTEDNPPYTRKALWELLANCSGDFIEQLYEIALVLSKHDS